MGRTEQSRAPVAQQAFRKDQRAKHAKSIINKTIPQILASDLKARQGVENARLISDPVRTASLSEAALAESKGQHGRKQSTSKSKRSTHVEEGSIAPYTDAQTLQPKPLKIMIQVADTLAAAQSLHQHSRSKKNVAILNMASPLRPGGGVLNGATSQEESLCVRTTLLSSLKEEWYRLPELGGIWSPDVLVFRDSMRHDAENLDKADRFYVDVITAAMTKFPELVEKRSDATEAIGVNASPSVEKMYASEKDRQLAHAKIKAVLSILQTQGTKRVVLGAFGCGAYGNPVKEIVIAFKKALLGNPRKSKIAGGAVNWSPLEEVVFAIKDVRMARDFAACWGDNIRLEMPERQNDDEGSEGEDGNIEELRQKIETLEMQLAEVKTPLLKKGLETTLASLKVQLATAEGYHSISEDD